MNPGPDTETQLAALEAERAAWQDRYVRLAAEFDNYKKRMQREMVDIRQAAGKEVVLDVLEIVDDMDRAERQEHANDEAFKEGAALIFDKMRGALKKWGVEKMASLKAEFNTDWHEAMTEIEVTDQELKNKVVDVLQEGYSLKGKLIRHAKVVVGK